MSADERLLSAEQLTAIRTQAAADACDPYTDRVLRSRASVMCRVFAHIDVQAEEIAALTERLEVVYRALKKINQHHTHDHHQDDPAMPMDFDVAAGYLAYDNRPRHWWASALTEDDGAQRDREPAS